MFIDIDQMQSHICTVEQETISYIILINDNKNAFIYYGSGYESICDTKVINDYNLVMFFTYFLFTYLKTI